MGNVLNIMYMYFTKYCENKHSLVIIYHPDYYLSIKFTAPFPVPKGVDGHPLNVGVDRFCFVKPFGSGYLSGT